MNQTARLEELLCDDTNKYTGQSRDTDAPRTGVRLNHDIQSSFDTRPNCSHIGSRSIFLVNQVIRA